MLRRGGGAAPASITKEEEAGVGVTEVVGVARLQSVHGQGRHDEGEAVARCGRGDVATSEKVGADRSRNRGVAELGEGV